MSPRTYIPFALLLLLAATGWTSDTPPTALHDLPDFSIPEGQPVYERYCLFCHGERGEGDGQNSFSLSTRAANLRQLAPERSDQQLAEIISKGGELSDISKEMPSFSHTLSQIRINKLIRYIRRFSGEQ